MSSYTEIGRVVSDKKFFFKDFYIAVKVKKNVPWRPRFFLFVTNTYGLNNLGRGLPKEHFCQVTLKSVQCFLTKKKIKFFYINI